MRLDFGLPLLILLSVVLGCSWAKHLQSSGLPEKMPENTSFRYSEDHGMVPTWYRIEIEANELRVFEKKDARGKESLRFAPITNAEKQTLYNRFRENKFDLIENHKADDITYDAGGDSISLRAGKESHRASSGDNSPISGGMSSNYGAVRRALSDFVKLKDSELQLFPQNVVRMRYSKRTHPEIEGAVRTEIDLKDLLRVLQTAKKALQSSDETNQFAESFDDTNVQAVTFKKDENTSVQIKGFLGTPKQDIRRNPISESITDSPIFSLFVDFPSFTARDLKVSK